MLSLNIDGLIAKGEPIDIIRYMWQSCFYDGDFKNEDDYIKYILINLYRVNGISVKLSSSTTEGRAKELIDTLIKHNVIKKVNEEEYCI
jgi:hypothetical protein